MFIDNPEADRFRALAQNVADGLLHRDGGTFARRDRLTYLRRAYSEAVSLDASRAYLDHFQHVLQAIEALDGGKRRMTLRDARASLEHDIPRMSGSAHWPGARSQERRQPTPQMTLTPEFYASKAASVVQTEPTPPSSLASPGDRVVHSKFGDGVVNGVEGNKLVIAFDQAGEKKVIDTFVKRV